MVDPQFRNSPMYKLFFCFILDTLKELPKEQIKKIEAMNIQKAFNLETSDWREVIKHSMHLSDTIEIAIQDLWLKNSKTSYEKKIELGSNEFTALFIENFLREDSEIDIWKDEESLLQAKKRISESYLKQ